MRKPSSSRRISRRRALVVAIAILGWLGLLALSNSVQQGMTWKVGDREFASVPTPLASGSGDGEITISYKRTDAAVPSGDPILLLHGSPGSADGFEEFARAMSDDGRTVIAVDLPGFGASTRDLPDYSNRAHARACLSLMDELGFETAHVVGWSNGGVVAVWMADFEPSRISSITLLAATATQEGEGSGSYWFEHAKYGFGYAMLVSLMDFVPHFGLLGPREERVAFMRNFWDSDQRRVREVLGDVRVACAIVHSKSDFLVPMWAAESHAAIAREPYVVFLAPDNTFDGHFLPVMQGERVAGWLNPFYESVEDGSFTPSRESVTRYEPFEDRGARAFAESVLRSFRASHWTLEILVFALLAWIAPIVGLVVGVLVVAHMSVDIAVCIVGLTVGLWMRRLRRGDMRWARYIGVFYATIAMVSLLWIPARFVVLAWWERGQESFVLLAGVGACAMLWIAPRAWTFRSRRLAVASVRKLWRHEFWKMWVYYLPLAVWLPLLALRYRGMLVFTRVNPGIPGGGGIVGESKAQILEGLVAGDAPVLSYSVIPAGGSATARADAAARMVAEQERLGGYPIIVKPDVGERGRGVKLARDEASLRAWFEGSEGAAILQRFHPGPFEAGVFWIRDARFVSDEPEEGALAGRVFSITTKELPLVVGDGRRPLERLILDHPRYVMQHEMYAKRLGDRLGDIPSEGVEVGIGDAGNHSQGAIFRDGDSLITPELERVIDSMSRGFVGADAGGIDFCRFDIRCESAEALARGEGLAIIEMNGTLSESTNMWDPDRSVWFAWRVLLRQWGVLYAMGAARRNAGSKGLGFSGLARLLLGRG